MNVAVSFPKIVVAGGGGGTCQILQAIGNDTATFTHASLIGKSLLLVATDGVIRKNIIEYLFIPIAGQIEFQSTIFSDQTIHILYQ